MTVDPRASTLVLPRLDGPPVAPPPTFEPGAAEAPGALLGGRDLRLATSDGWLVLDEVQPAGKRPMSGESYARGRPELRDSV